MSIKERRRHPRTRFLKPPKYKVGVSLRRGEAVDAEILDVSAAGACIITDEPYEPDNIIWLRLPPHPRLANVRWVSQIEGRFKMGLQFLT